MKKHDIFTWQYTKNTMTTRYVLSENFLFLITAREDRNKTVYADEYKSQAEAHGYALQMSANDEKDGYALTDSVRLCKMTVDLWSLCEGINAGSNQHVERLSLVTNYALSNGKELG